MLSFVIRYFFIIFCSIYTYFKILNINISKKSRYIWFIASSAIISISNYLFSTNYSSFNSISLFFFYFCFMLFYSKTKTRVLLSTSITSFAISYMSLSISTFIICIFTIPFFKSSFILTTPPFMLFGGFLQYLLIHFLFNIKRLKGGMPFLYKREKTNIIIWVSLAFIIYNAFLATLPSSHYPHNILSLVFILFLAFLLLFWWRRRITLDYVQKLRMDEVESLYKKISDNEREIEKLNTNNDYLSKVIHKDNKLIPAMEMALHSYLLEAPTMEAEEARQFGADLLSQLQSMSAEREGIISNYQKNTDSHPKIGIYSVDAVILYMEKRAEKFNITYNLRFDNDIKDAIVGFIHERDMLHLLSDLIENAIIAVKDASHREIFLHIGFLQGGLFIDLYDSGIPFEPAVYQDFGNCQHTTHADSGGSGIGLMDIWNLKRKYKASLQIYEYLPDSDIYTKKIRLLFDRRNHFLLQTYRDKEIRSFITRSDLHVFPLKEMKKKDKE